MSMNREVPFLYRLGKFLLAPVFRLYYNPKIIGKENIPVNGPVLIVGNHKHVFDQFPTIISTKREIHYMAKKEYFDKPFSRWIFTNVGCIPVNRKIKDNDAIEAALSVLRDDGAIGLFPEGTRNKTDNFLLPFKFGTVSMAKKTGALIVPFGITGDYKFRSKNLTIRYGKPFKVDKMDLKEANKKLYNEIKKLMKENLK